MLACFAHFNSSLAFSRPTSVDSVVFAHLALLLYPPLPQAVMASLLRSDFPSLVSHTDRMRATLFPISTGTEPSSPHWPQIRPPTSVPLLVTLKSVSQTLISSFSDLFPMPSSPFPAKKRSKEEEEFKKRRLWWATGVVVAFTTFALWNGIVSMPALRFRSTRKGELLQDDVDDDEDDEIVIEG
jgi:Glutathione S-transferase, C-terminal domain